MKQWLREAVTMRHLLPVSRIDRAGCRAKQYDTAPATCRAYTRIVLGLAAHHLPDRRFIRSVSGAHVLGAPAYASTVTSPPMVCAMHLCA